MRTTYTACDGTVFDDSRRCLEHERDLLMKELEGTRFTWNDVWKLAQELGKEKKRPALRRIDEVIPEAGVGMYAYQIPPAHVVQEWAEVEREVPADVLQDQQEEN